MTKVNRHIVLATPNKGLDEYNVQRQKAFPFKVDLSKSRYPYIKKNTFKKFSAL
jgi:hypothetical protein